MLLIFVCMDEHKSIHCQIHIFLLDVPDGLEGLVATQHLFIKQSGLPIESLSLFFTLCIDYKSHKNKLHTKLSIQFLIA